MLWELTRELARSLWKHHSAVCRIITLLMGPTLYLNIERIKVVVE